MTMLTVDDLARDLKVRNEDLLRELVTMGYEVEGPESPLETDDPAALRAQLVTILPQREVVEKRIKPTVIRRRVKKAPASAEEVEYAERAPAAVARPARPAPHHAERAAPKDAARGETSEPGRRPAKKSRRPEPARIIEMAPKPAPLVPSMEHPAPESEVETEEFPTRLTEVRAQAVSEGTAERATEMEAPSVESAQAPATAGEGPASRPGQATPAGEDRGLEDRSGRKKKKKEKRLQPAQIIGKVELKKEPPREAEPAERPRPERPERPAARPGERPPLGDRGAPRPLHGPRPPRPGEAPAAKPQPPADELLLEEERRRKKKAKEKKGREGVEERPEDDKVPVRRRKEVVLGADLYDDKVRGGRFRGRGKRAKPRKTEITVPKASKRRIKLPEKVTVANLAHRMSTKVTKVIQHLMTLGVAATVNENVDYETAAIVATEFGFEAEPASNLELELLPTRPGDLEQSLVSRSPVVTVMGHVDHGKTSLLDAIRSTHVTDQEAGGITQHIGAYKVRLPKGELVFLDTPGHEAFTAMRARGAQVTDFVVLVVAADDGVMDQTREAINHSRAANVPIIVAVNKMDKPEADKDRVLRELSEFGLIPESWGGDTLFSYVSAKQRQGIDELLEMILLQAEMMELRANPNKQATGTVIEARLDKGKGPVATVLVKEGTLKLGDAFVSGFHFGKVRAMLDHEGRSVEQAGPATPVEVHGFSGVPEAGEVFVVVDEEKIARQISIHRLDKQRVLDVATGSGMNLEELLARMAEQEHKELNLIIKGDVQGSVEAVKEALLGIPSQEIKIKVIHSAVGGVTESDVMLASASHAIIIGFNVRPSPKASQLAEQEKIDVRLYTIIYEAIEDIRKAMEGMLAPIEREIVVGRAEVRQTFHVAKIGNVAGCYVVSGKIERPNQVRLIRDDVVIYTGRIISMKRFKEDVKEAVEGYECGLVLENYRDVKVGDIIEAFTIEQESAKLI